jgi:hypothetical protein
MKNIELSFQRLGKDEYQIDNVFQKGAYSWQGDWEGRALLAFGCLFEATGREIPCMHEMIDRLQEKTNNDLYFGAPFDGIAADEQQLSGHSWYLRGLVKYAQNFKSEIAERAMRLTVKGLYLPLLDWYKRYPLDRNAAGGVSGEVVGAANGWRLSSDVGCAYMCVDGLAHYYAYTKDEECRRFLDGIIDIFDQTDFVKYGFQTHTTLSCLRGILKLYEETGEKRYLDIVKDKFNIYLRHGMTLTYENYNWFGRMDTWTEPCAVVDSFILATRLYRLTDEAEYLTLARRIWFNGLQFCQRSNGGAGPNTCVTVNQPILKISMYEAPFCCTMRYCEGVLEYWKNRELFAWDGDKQEETDDLGRRFIDDKLLVQCNGHIQPIFACHDIPKDEAKQIELKIIF